MLSDIMRMALLNDYQSVFLKAAFNSILPEFMDSDEMDLNKTVSPEFIAVLRKVLDHYYGSDEITQSHIDSTDDPERLRMLKAGGVDYAMVNDLFKQSSFYGTRKYDGIPTDIKMVLGKFLVSRNDDGSYDITDKYDFASNQKFLEQYAPEVTEVLQDMGFEESTIKTLYSSSATQMAAGVGGSIMTMHPHSMARMFGGIFMSDQESPEEGGAQHTKLHISREDKVDNVRPSPRPTWFEDENVEPVFPSTPMDDERKGLLDMAMEAIFPSAEADEAPAPSMPLPTSKPVREKISSDEGESFSAAFARNRRAGVKQFEWQGKQYTTEVA
jgi:hypothetical protein